MGSRLVLYRLTCFACLACGWASTVQAGPGDTHFWLSASDDSGVNAAPPTMAPIIPKAPGSTGTLYLWAKLATVRNDNGTPQTDSLAAWSLRLVTTQTNMLSFTTSTVNNPVMGMPGGQPQYRWQTINEPSGQSNPATPVPPAPATNSIQDLQGFNLPFGAGMGTGIGPGTAGGSWLLGQIDYSLNSTLGNASVYLQIGDIGANYAGQSSTFTSVVLGHATDAALNADSQRARNSLVVDATIAVSAGLPGDFDADGDSDGADFLKWQRGESPAPNSSGDLTLWRNNFGRPASGVRSPADFNDDDRVDGADFLVWQRGVGIPNATPGQGDANGDGVVNGADLGVWRNLFGDVEATAVAVSVPEPSGGTLFLAAVGMLGCWLAMANLASKKRLPVIAAWVGLLLFPATSRAQVTATWLPAGPSQNYSNPANWSGGVVPINGAQTYGVVIGSETINFDVAGDSTVDTFSLAAGSIFSIAAAGRNLEVLGAATISGRITTNGSSFVAGPGSTFVGSTLFASGGGVIDLVDATTTNYQVTISGSSPGDNTFMQATGVNASGVGSVLNLLSLQSLQATETQTGGRFLTIHAANGGLVDLRNVTSAARVGGDGGDRLQFLIQGGANGQGNIRLDNLAAISGVRFNVQVPNYSLPRLDSVFQSDFNVVAGASINAPILQSLNSSSVTLTGSGALTTAGLTNIDHSRFFLNNGASFAGVTATAYQASFQGSTGSDNIFMQASGVNASGVGSLLSLSSLQTLQVTETAGSSPRLLTVHAANRGLVDLRNLTSAARVGGDAGDQLQFLIQGGANGQGNIRLDNLAAISGVRFNVQVPNYSLPQLASVFQGDFNVTAGASLSLPSLQYVESANINVSGLQSAIEIGGAVNFGSGQQVTIASGGKLTLGGNFSFRQTTESQLAMSSGTLVLDGEGQQQLEIGGQDVGVGGTAATNGGNFGIARLFVGTATTQSNAKLVDLVNNGNRNGSGGAAESLYLYGSGGQAGLVLVNGSTLALNGLNLYAYDPSAGANVRLNSLFGPGVLTIPYSGGTLQLLSDVGPFAWNVAGSGNWYEGTNWSPQFIPDGDFKAIFGNAASGPTTVIVNQDIRISEIQFNNAAQSYTIAADATHGLELIGAAAIEVTAGAHTISAPISGVNGLAKSGPGTLRLSGSNSYTGPTVVRAGTLQASAAANLGNTESITVETGATLDVSGASVYQLRANQTLTGRGTVRADLLTLSPTSEIRGTLQIQGDVASAGRVAPGFSPGITTILGNFSQQPDGVLEMEVGGQAPGTQHDLLIVTGTASLSGRLEIPIIDGYIPQQGHSMQLILAGNVVGEFDSHSILPDLATLNSDVAHEVVTTPGGVRLRFLAPSTDNLFDPDAPTANWAETTNWSTGVVPDTVDIITLENASGQTQRLDVEFLPMLANSKNAFTHELTLMGSGQTMAVSIQQGSSLSATVGVNVAESGLIELAGGTVVTSTLDVLDGGMVAGGGTVVGNYQQDAGGELVLQIDGLNDFDAIDISREANLGGTLTVALNDLSIGAGEEFAVITAGSLAAGSTFDRVRTVGGGDIQFKPIYDESDPDQLIVKLQSFEFTKGDMNGDGIISEDDAAAIALALRDPAQFARENPLGMDAVEAGDRHPVGPGGLDGDFDFDDVLVIFEESFSTIMSFGQFTELLDKSAAVPEPGAATLALLGVAMLAVRGKLRPRCSSDGCRGRL